MKDVFSPWRLTGIGTPMAVWALHLLVVYSLQGLACAEGWSRTRIAGLEPLGWGLLALTLAALGGLAWLGVRAWHAWRIARLDPDMPPPRAARRRFAAAVTGALAGMAAVAVCFTAIPVLLLPGCA